MNEAFEGDTFIRHELIKLRDRFQLLWCCETGSQYGSTTLALYDIFKNVTTIEADKKYYDIAVSRFGGLNIECILGKSQDFISEFQQANHVLYYLDAHGCEIGGCPLKEELKAIASQQSENICIAIHDCKVPGKDFGYDTYDYEICYEEIKPYLKKIYPLGFDYHYNEQADGAYRGILYIYPKQKQ